jgi:hypothetical protein
MIDGDDETVLNLIEDLMTVVLEAKPRDKSPKDRYYSVIMTDIEKLYAYFKTYIVEV